MESFYICKRCGCSEHEPERHKFVHKPEYTSIVKVNDEKGESFEIDSNDFPIKETMGKCTFPQCGKPKEWHGTFLKHDFISSPIFHREITFRVPLKSRCRVCTDTLSEHFSLDHKFTIYLKIIGEKESDVIKILDSKGKDITRAHLN